MDSELNHSPARPIKAVSLLSGGLDSILATRVVQDQGVEVLALHFISPFFGYEKKGREEEVAAFYQETYGIRMRVVDVSDEYLTMLARPRYGYGKNFNPCVDCKIFLVRKALEILQAEGASFLITGEVLGQRPMSQRRDTLNAIARDTGTRGILLRPLSARLLPPTAPEERGWVDRGRLYGFSGRGRHDQMALAAELGITEYPTPAGGCRLTDPCLGARVRRYYEDTPAEGRNAADVRVLLTGRPFRFPEGSLFSLGRGEHENAAVAGLAREGDERVFAADVPGPLGLFRPRGSGDERPLAAAVLLRYCPKARPETRVVFEPSGGGPVRELEAVAATDEDIALGAWRL
ncbi:MAG: 7-cyano-7-deazaguanine synthase [Deltaproteobacteria bacterium]|nr:7-cyano-7-deazaguanine synthase [Deltaproteobacteria bacterium]